MFEEVIILYSCTENGAVLKKRPVKSVLQKLVLEIQRNSMNLEFI